MTKVRPIQTDEIDNFISVGNDSARLLDVKGYFEQLLVTGSTRLDWCFIVEEANQLQGRVAYWTLPKSGKPLFMVLLELPWESEHYLMIGTCLLQKTLPLIHAMGAEKIGYVLDSPALPPQWQSSPEQRIRLLEHNGFSLERETCRFEWKGHNDQFDKSNEIVFRTLSEVGDATFIEAIMRVSESTLDRSINQDREQNGDKLQAQTMFTELQQMDYDPAWWQLAFTLNEELIGIVMPTKNPTYATIGYIGVVPEQRGRGYIDILLHQATSLLTDAGESMIRADTDVENTPMIHAFKRAGYIQFAKRCEYNRDLSAL